MQVVNMKYDEEKPGMKRAMLTWIVGMDLFVGWKDQNVKAPNILEAALIGCN